MTSNALNGWREERAARLEELIDAHQRIGGSVAGRRWQTEQLNWALILRLAAEFQGFARELHDLGAQAVSASASGPMVGVVQRSLVLNRQLDRGNAQPSALGADFGRFGVDWWPELTKRDARTTGRQQQLELLNRARNAIVHSLPTALAQLENEGHPPTLASMVDLRPGDEVEVPWGLDQLIGVVREVYGPPGKPFVMVEVPVHGASGEILETTTLSFPADALALISGDAL